MTLDPKFLRRFEQLRASLRRYQAWTGLAATILVAAIGLGTLAWSDYHQELSRSSRAVGLGIALLASLVVLWGRLISPLRWWTQPRTAVEIEERFPELGQRIRTVVQYAGQDEALISSEGVKPSLVRALEEETEERVTSLPLHRVVRRRRAQVLAILAAVPVALVVFMAARSHEWRVALLRSVLIERPYTTVEVQPGNLLVDQGETVRLAIQVSGRPRKSVVLQTRPASKSDGPWKSETLETPAKGQASRREATVEKVRDPVEYRVVAGPAESGRFEIRVRYPLAIKDFEVKVTSPAYTGLDPRTTKGGDVQAVEGSVATFKIAFDAPPAEASLEMTDHSRKSPGQGEPEPRPTILPLKREGDALVATLDLANSLDYKVVARTTDGRVLPKNKYRVDVREDRAPRVVFDEPDEALEVHPIAEVRHRARVDDDFGLTRAGIVFRFNDGEEKTLISRDFPIVAGKKPKTSATLEEILLLETLKATPQDSVTYYAFAEDNFPGSPRRTETDLRYIDLRAFKREYKLAEPGSGEGDPDEFIALDELIARQRVNLNRANRLAKHKTTDRTAAEDPLKIAGFEETLLGLTKEFTGGIEALADARVDALHKAIDAMQASIDSLDKGRNAEVPPAMAEALKNLVAARRELFTLIANSPALAAAMKQYDRKQAQKIRKPKNKDEEAEELVDRIEELAQEEDFVYATLTAKAGPVGDAEEGGKPKPKDAKKQDEAKDAEKKDEAKDAEKGQEGPQGQGGKGEGRGGEDEAQGEPSKIDRRAVAEKQEKIADEVRDLEEKLKRLEVASDLAKARMAKAAEKVEKASGDLARGNAKGAMEDTKAGAGMLHELARQLKGEIAKESVDELAMARDLAEELARREAEFAEGDPGQSSSGEAGDQEGKAEGEKGEGKGSKPGRGGQGGWAGLTEAEQIARMAEMAITLEEWLKQVDKKGQGKAADAVGEILEKGNVAEIVERAGRMGDLRVGGKREELGKEAKDLASKLEILAQSLEMLHRGIVAPELAALVDFDRRVAELTAKLGDLKTEVDVANWKRAVAALIRDLEKAGIDGADGLADALRVGGGLHWDDRLRRYVLADATASALRSVSIQIKDRVQELILKDLASARDEATPPNFRELVDRYYEVISKGVRAR